LESRNSVASEQTHILEVERRVLGALCQGTPQGSVRATARDILRTYRWREPLHQIVFEVVLSIPTEAPEVIREQLLARLTRKGFPDVNIEDFFKPHGLSKEEAERLIRQLRDSERSSHGQCLF
jgi:hypothetical protein